MFSKILVGLIGVLTLVSAYLQSEPGALLSVENATLFKQCIANVSNYTGIIIHPWYESVDFLVSDDAGTVFDRIKECIKLYNVYLQLGVGYQRNNGYVDCVETLRDYTPREYTEYEVNDSRKLGNDDFAIMSIMVRKTPIGKDPESYNDAMFSPDADQWKQACDVETGVIAKPGVYDLLEPPKMASIMTGRRALKRKFSDTGTPLKYKAHSVVRGFMEETMKRLCRTCVD